MAPRGLSIHPGGARGAGYTRAQVLLHWTVAALVAGQYATSGAITRTHGMHMIGWKPSPADMALHTLHNRAGLAIIALMVIRLALRVWAGAPQPGVAGRCSTRLAQLAHAAFYAVLITEGVTGAVASYLWWPISAVHVILFKILLGLVTIHVAAALWHWLILKDDTLDGMGAGPFRKPLRQSTAAEEPGERSRWGVS